VLEITVLAKGKAIVIQTWTCPVHPSYNLFDARLHSFNTWTHRERVPSPESLAEAGFFYQGTLNSCFSNTLTFISHTLTRVLLLLLQVTSIILRAFIVESDCAIGFLQTFHSLTCKMVPIVCLSTVYQGENLHC
jgi:hypothetical protein